MIYKTDCVSTRFNSRLGNLTLAATKMGLCGLWFEWHKYQPQLGIRQDTDSDTLLCEAKRQVLAWLAGEASCFDLPIDLRAGTVFQQRVWQALLGIPRGTTISYAQVGERIGQPGANRAVGAAVGRNPLSIIVPCHRVVGTNGALTGYAGGIDRKRELLRLEAVPALKSHGR